MIPIWWITYCVNKWTHKTYLVLYWVTIMKKKLKFIDFCNSSLCIQVAPRSHNFWNKWSWGLCVMPIWRITYNVNKCTHKTYLVMYLVTILKKVLKFVDFWFTDLCTQVAPRSQDFWNKWSWGLCVMYLVTIMKKNSQICRFLIVLHYNGMTEKPHDHLFENSGQNAITSHKRKNTQW